MEVRLFDHFPALLAFGIGIGVTMNGRSELAMEFFLMAILAEITRDLAGLRKDVKALRDRAEERQP